VFQLCFGKLVGGFWVDIMQCNFSYLKQWVIGFWLACPYRTPDFQEQITDNMGDGCICCCKLNTDCFTYNVCLYAEVGVSLF